MTLEQVSEATKIPLAVLRRMCAQRLIAVGPGGGISSIAVAGLMKNNSVLCQVDKIRRQLAAEAEQAAQAKHANQNKRAEILRRAKVSRDNGDFESASKLFESLSKQE